MFSSEIYGIFNNTWFEVCERLLLKPVLSPGLPFLITYTSGSNWYICFSFCIIIYSFISQFSCHYYWYCYNQKNSSGGVLQKRCSYKFRRKHLRWRLFFNEVADLQSYSQGKAVFHQDFTQFCKGMAA